LGKSLDRQRDLNKVKFLKRKEHKAKKYAKYGHKYGTPSYNKNQLQIQQDETMKEFAAKLGIKL
jgi:phosphoglucomutase